jgi:hypothetical protein
MIEGRPDAPSRPATPGASQRWKTAAIEAAVAVAITRAVFLVVGYASSWLLASSRGPLSPSVLDIWVHWDARHFLEVATFGYTDPATDPNAPAFFPLYPLLIRALDGLGVPSVAAAMIIATLATWVACMFLFLLAEDDVGPRAGRKAISYVLLFPTAVFLIAPYSEALFLAGATGAFYFARRGRWAAAAVPLAVATATRAAGLFLIVGLVCEVARKRRGVVDVVRAGGALAAGLLPMFAYFAYLMRIEGTPAAYLSAQRVGWHREFVGPVESLLQTWDQAMNGTAPTNWLLAWRFELVAAVVGLGFTIWAIGKREWGYAAYMGTTMAALVTSTWYFSIPRMLLTLFPIYLLIASATFRRPVLHEAVLVSFGSLAVLGVIVFTQGAWFF